MKRVDPKDLEAALPTLIAKLQSLQKGLSPEECVVFGELIQSAANHTEVVTADDEGLGDRRVHAKPMSTHSTTAMRGEFLRLPQTLGVKSDAE